MIYIVKKNFSHWSFTVYFQEHTFEEAIAEQQKFASSLLKGEKGNVKEKEKKPKKSTKKTKDKEKKDVEPTIVAPSVAVEGKPHVEFEPDEEIITEDPVPTQAEDEKKKTDKKEKVTERYASMKSFSLIIIIFLGQTHPEEP